MHIRRSRTLSKQSSAFVRRKYELIVLRRSVIIILFIIFICGILYISRLQSLSISSIEVYGVNIETATSIREKVNETIRGKYFGLFSRANAFIYPKNEIIASIQVLNPRIEEVTVNLKDRRVLAISITEKIAGAVVCTSLPDFDGNKLILEEAEGCYFVDGLGVIFAEAPVFSGSAYRRYYAPDIISASSSQSMIGNQVLVANQFEALQSFYEDVRQAMIIAEAILIKPDGEYELYISNPTYVSGDMEETTTAVVYFNSTASLEDQIANLISFWTNQLSSGHTKGLMPVFDSIDVRYGSNIFYRLNNQ